MIPPGGNDLTLTLTSDIRIGVEGPSARARTLLREGDTRFCALSWGSSKPPKSYKEAYERLTWTAHHWQHWLARGNFPDHRWRSYLTRSALTLKGLTFAPTGAVAAAATTSLPETPRGERNWDYRYSWIRDATFALWGLFTLGFDWEANDYFAFLTDVVERNHGNIQIVYGIDGRCDQLDEDELEHLHGYQGARPVRIGNEAYTQRQNDVWGVVLDSLYLHTRSRDRLDERVWQMARNQVEHALEHWRERDRGIWEIRGEPKHFTSSKLMCWVAADRGARLARVRDDTDIAARWQEAADEIHADICANAIDDRGVFCQHYETDALDASLLLMPLLRFLPPEDPRIRATVLAIARRADQDGLVLRYRVEETDDGLQGEEGTFTICSFWLVSALVEIGEHERARDLCEKVLSHASPLLLYAEEIEAKSGRHLGNFPQAFTHLALINAVMHVVQHEQAAEQMATKSGATVFAGPGLAADDQRTSGGQRPNDGMAPDAGAAALSRTGGRPPPSPRSRRPAPRGRTPRAPSWPRRPPARPARPTARPGRALAARTARPGHDRPGRARRRSAPRSADRSAAAGTSGEPRKIGKQPCIRAARASGARFGHQAGHPDRHRVLDRDGPERRRVHGQPLPVERDRLADQQAPQRLQRVVEKDAALARLGDLAERTELLPAVVAEAHADHQPATGQPVERGHLAGQHPRAGAGTAGSPWLRT